MHTDIGRKLDRLANLLEIKKNHLLEELINNKYESISRFKKKLITQVNQLSLTRAGLLREKIRELFNQTSFNILTIIKMDFTNPFDDW